MAFFMGRNGGVPTLAIGTNDSTLHNYPPDSSLVFRSDLPYITVSEYYVNTYTDTTSAVGTVRYFTLPTEVRSAMSALNVVLFFWVNGSTVVACTPQYSAESWYGSMWGSANLSGSYINKNFTIFNPSFISGFGSNWLSSSVVKGATSPQLTATHQYMFNLAETKIGFPLFSNRTFTPIQLKCVVLDNLKYTSSTNPALVHVKNTVSTGVGIKISKTQFLINGVDFRTKKLLVYANTNSKPTNATSVSDVSGNILTKYPGIATYTSNKLYSVARTEYRADSSGDKAFTLTPSQYNILSGLKDLGSSIIGMTGYGTFRTTTNPTISDFSVPVFGVMQAGSTSASVEIISSSSTIKLGGLEFLSPNIKPLTLISSSKTFTFTGGTNVTLTTSSTPFPVEKLLGTLTDVFRTSTSKGCGILTLYSTNQPDYNHNVYITNENGVTPFNVKSANMVTSDFTYLHSSLVQLNDGEKITLFTNAMNTANVDQYVAGVSGGISSNIFIQRSGSSLLVYARFDDGNTPLFVSTGLGSSYRANINIVTPSITFSFTELQ